MWLATMVAPYMRNAAVACSVWVVSGANVMLPLIVFYFVAGVALIAVCNWIDGR